MSKLRTIFSSFSHRVRFRQALIGSGLLAFGLFLVFLVLTGETWRAVAYALVVLFGSLFVLAAYFWSMMLFGGVMDTMKRRETPVPWTLAGGENLLIPEHNIDPGLELVAAGMLVYRIGEVRPSIHFRQVPLADVRGLRPFVVARTGEARDYSFEFDLNNERHAICFHHMFDFRVTSAPQLIMPSMMLVPDKPNQLIGQRWRLRVRSGVTVVTSFGFMFVAGHERSGQATTFGSNGQGEMAVGSAWQEDLLPHLLDESLKHDAMIQLDEVVLEGQ